MASYGSDGLVTNENSEPLGEVGSLWKYEVLSMCLVSTS